MNEIESSKTMLSEVYRLIQIFLVIAVTTVTAERTFFSLKRLKTFLRSTMTQPQLNAFMLMYVHRDLTESMDLTDIAKGFVSVNDRRFYFGCFQNTSLLNSGVIKTSCILPTTIFDISSLSVWASPTKSQLIFLGTNLFH